MKRTRTTEALTLLGQIMTVLKLAKLIEDLTGTPNGLKVLVAAASSTVTARPIVEVAYQGFIGSVRSEFVGPEYILFHLYPRKRLTREELDIWIAHFGYEHGNLDDALCLQGQGTQFQFPFLALGQCRDEEEGKKFYPVLHPNGNRAWVRIDTVVPARYGIVVKKPR